VTEFKPRSSLEHFFSNLTDPRSTRNQRHQMIDILTISICAIICGAEYWTEVEEFGLQAQEWLQTFLELPNGIPSHDTFSDFFRFLDPEQFELCFMDWTKHVAALTKGEVIAIDGKTLRGSHDRSNGRKAMHMVSAYATSNQLVLGQLKTAEKSNEITAIPELIRVLDLEGAIVTIDAMGCQKEIASIIQDNKADYILSLKENHGNLYESVNAYFSDKKLLEATAFHDSELELNHGRLERRRCYVTDDINWLYQRKEWKGLRSIVAIETESITRDSTLQETRYYLTSLPSDPKQIQAAIRSHWLIENSLHWLLDVSFSEDACRVRKDHGPENFSVLRRIALNLLKRESRCRLGVKSKRKKAGWSFRYLACVLEQMVS